MEQNKNRYPFATSDAAWSPRPGSRPALPAVLDFEPVDLRARQDGWTPARQRAFIEELADCGIVREAAARVGMTEQAAHRLRRRPEAAAFNIAWDAALRIGADRLRAIAFDRAVNGTLRKRYYRGQVVGEERVYNDRLLIYLLARSKPLTDGLDVVDATGDWDRWMQAIEDGLDRPIPAPDGKAGSPVWESRDGSWWTSFPPPPGFNGRQHGAFGDADYRRECTLDEIAAIGAGGARREAEQGRRRDLYFTRMK